MDDDRFLEAKEKGQTNAQIAKHMGEGKVVSLSLLLSPVAGFSPNHAKYLKLLIRKMECQFRSKSKSIEMFSKELLYISPN
jgi:hypothetical protein